MQEDGQVIRSAKGTPQGAVISPVLANIYLHYVFDLWVNTWRKRRAYGDVVVIRYADDTVLGFQYERDAYTFRQALAGRLAKFGLDLHPGRTRLIQFGRFASAKRRQRGLGKPETFEFLGFTHCCTRSRQNGWFKIARVTSHKRLRAQLRAVKDALRRRINRPIGETGRWLRRVIQGHMNYFAVSGNGRGCRGSCSGYLGYGSRCSGVEANATECPGHASLRSVTSSFRKSVSCIHNRCIVLTPEPEGGAQCVSSACWDLCGGC